MMSYWLDKMLGANDDGNNLGKLVPLIIFFVIWAVSAISKAAQKGKKGTEAEPKPSEESQEPSFDDLARKIRERYAEAKEQAIKNREAQQGGNEQFSPPARPVKPAAAVPARISTSKPPQESLAVPKPLFEVTRPADGPSLRVVKGLQNINVGDHLEIEKPNLLKVDSALEKVDALTSENAKVSSEVEIIHHQYLSELGEQYSTADGFRKAILNYEILGPPVSLRCAVDTQNEAF